MQFKDIVGQRDVINRMTEIIDSGRISHAQLILGPSEDGSLQLALAYLQYLCCTDRKHYGDGDLRADSCGCCPSCKKIGQLMHPDLHLFFPTAPTSSVKDNTSAALFQKEFHDYLLESGARGSLNDWLSYLGIENKQAIINVRDAADIISSLSLKSYEGGWKMVVVWMADKMNTQSANELLKTLEEPSPGTVILLTAESDERMLSTIRSRVQTIRMQPTGNNREAELAEQFAPLLVAWLRLLFKLKMKELNTQIEQLAALGREQQKLFLKYTIGVMRGCFLNTEASIPYSIGSGDAKFDAMFPKMITQNNIELVEKALSEAAFAIERNANPKIALMELSFRMSKALKKK